MNVILQIYSICRELFPSNLDIISTTKVWCTCKKMCDLENQKETNHQFYNSESTLNQSLILLKRG